MKTEIRLTTSRMKFPLVQHAFFKTATFKSERSIV